MRRLHRPGWSGTALSLALAATLGLASCGDEGPAAAPAPGTDPVASTLAAPTSDAETPGPHPIQFLNGLAAGVEAAGDPDALLFVYLGRHQPT